MKVINHNCAGIDVGSRSHFVAIGQGVYQVKEFGFYAEDLMTLSRWLNNNKIKSVSIRPCPTEIDSPPLSLVGNIVVRAWR